MEQSNQRIDVAIGILVVRRDGSNLILIARRPAAAVLGGFWEFPGGKVELGETPAACLVREFAEETGLAVRVGAALPVSEYPYPHGTVRLHPFYCSLERGSVTPPGATPAEGRWVRPAELTDYAFPPANAALLERLRAELP